MKLNRSLVLLKVLWKDRKKWYAGLRLIVDDLSTIHINIDDCFYFVIRKSKKKRFVPRHENYSKNFTTIITNFGLTILKIFFFKYIAFVDCGIKFIKTSVSLNVK